MYDAILSGDGASAPAFDSEMDKFMPMLTDYLKSEAYVCPRVMLSCLISLCEVHDMSPPSSPYAGNTVKPSVPIPESKSQDADYVWDVFYHRPTKLSEWNAVANFGTLCVDFYRLYS